MISENIIHDYHTLELRMSLASARIELASGYGVLWDNDGRFVTIIMGEDLEGFAGNELLAEVVGQLPPGVMTEVSESMDRFVQSPVFAVFAVGARGAILYDGTHVAGILTDEAIRRFLTDPFIPVSEEKSIPTDSMLAGSITNRLLVMYCDEFAHRNELKYYNRHKPADCQVQEPYLHRIRNAVDHVH